jgi:2,3-bisphosphoglycerate-independent phosphoglycerate mutase
MCRRPPRSEYVAQLETVLAELSDGTHEYKIASGGGRMQITMDRYEANWSMVEAGWRTHVQGIGRQFPDAKTAIETTARSSAASTRICPPL